MVEIGEQLLQAKVEDISADLAMEDGQVVEAWLRLILQRAPRSTSRPVRCGGLGRQLA